MILWYSNNNNKQINGFWPQNNLILFVLILVLSVGVVGKLENKELSTPPHCVQYYIIQTTGGLFAIFSGLGAP